ncbi:hypothetical protein ACFVAQ_32035 [Streptomyces sp. NPDC057651]|uniref:hypothetical protein n=1 Tax=unclassified Streptomyces TaxID=2593676 RepID=UPI0036BD699B
MYASGRFQINGQFVKLGPRHAGKIVTVVIEDTHFRILRGEDELAVRPRKNPGLITRLYVKGMGQLAFTESMVDGTAERISALGASRTAPDLSSPSPPGTTAASAARTRWLISVHSTLSAGVVKDHRGAVVKVDPAAEDLLPELFSRCVRMNQ